MARVSVVVPMYNVERYLDACLGSIARQTFTDLDVLMVDDGSTDGTAEIARGYADADERFTLIRQPNGGLGNARNTGSDAATGEYLAFVDSDDVLAPDAYERLAGTLDRTGSDFATGNVWRIVEGHAKQAYFVSHVFTRTRLRTHVSRHRELLLDRTAWNKLWRRSFWDAHGYRFPEGVYNEDIPVTIPAHVDATAVDVIAEPVYYWRARDEGGSITQKRAEMKALLDRLAAVEAVVAHLRAHGTPELERWYETSLLAHDLRYHLDVLDVAGDEYRQVFLDRVNALLDGADPRVMDPLPAGDQALWRHVRARDLDGLLAALRASQQAPPSLKVRLYRLVPQRQRMRLRGLLQSVRR
jgi:CDP-glycerol glycerophosphotransferase